MGYDWDESTVDVGDLLLTGPVSSAMNEFILQTSDEATMYL